MKKLRAYYERELGALQGFSREFGEQFPGLARRLGIASGVSEDPHLEHLIQASALSNARTAQLIDSNDGKITEALLNINYPHYLRPFPSTAIAAVNYLSAAPTMTAITVIRRGTMMNSKPQHGVSCKFRSAYDVTLAPLKLSAVHFHPVMSVPLPLMRPPESTSAISIVIDSLAATLDLEQMDLPALRIYIDGEPAHCATIRDALFLRAGHAYLCCDDGAWQALPSIPIRAVGFDEHDALIPFKAASHPAYRLLTEYFAFPEKFNFFDIDWPALKPSLPAGCRRLTLHLGLLNTPSESDMARGLRALSHKNFMLACTPVINLFPLAASPIELTHTCVDYGLLPNQGPAHGYDIYSVDQARVVRDSPSGQSVTPFLPYYALRHGEGVRQRCGYYLLRRDPLLAVTAPGHETRITFVDRELDPEAVETAIVSLDLTCTNRDLPSRLPHGAPDGDLNLERAGGNYLVRLLRKPTPAYRFGTDLQWRLISHLALNHGSLLQQGAAGLRETLTLYNLPQSAISQRQIGGIQTLTSQPARAWLRDRWGSSIVHGVEISISVDEEAFAGTGIHIFTQVLDHFFGLYVHLNSFVQLIILSHATGKELLRCQPRNGDIALA